MRETTIKNYLDIFSKTCSNCKYKCSEKTKLSCTEAVIRYSSIKSTQDELARSLNKNLPGRFS
jgi:hypothetical protein